MEQKAAKTESEKHQRVLIDKLNKFLSPDKPSDVLIIKAHLICEYYLNHYLILKDICTPKQLSGFTFYQKLQKALVKADVFEQTRFESITKLNKLRNKVGHELEYSLSESDVDSLGLGEGKEYILKKYDFEELADLLRITLVNIVIDLSFVVMRLAESVRKSDGKTDE